jgi:MerR family transcriptional regulator/heat shock protein HspR
MSQFRPERDPERPVYVISVAATLVSAHPRTLRIYEDEGLLCPARTPTNIRLYSENDIRRLTWIRHLTRDRGVNLAGIKLLFELEERLGARILEALYAEATDDKRSDDQAADDQSTDAPTDHMAPATKTTTKTSTPNAAATATANPNLGDT